MGSSIEEKWCLIGVTKDRKRERERQGTPVWDLQQRHAHLAADRTASQVSRSNWTPLIRQSTLWHT